MPRRRAEWPPPPFALATCSPLSSRAAPVRAASKRAGGPRSALCTSKSGRPAAGRSTLLRQTAGCTHGPTRRSTRMRDALEATQASGWVLSHEGYNVLTESAVESRLAFGNGFLGMRAARSVSRGPTWVAWLGYSRWASWPRCYVAGLFDMPNTEPPVPALVPVADWSRVRILLDGEPLLAREGEVLLGTRKL